MDTLAEIKRKIDSGNTISVTAATDNLVNMIKSKIKGNRSDMTNIPEMLLLQEYCCNPNPIISTTTLRALCTFMMSNNYQNQLLIDWLVVLNPQIKCRTGFIQEIFELIVFGLKNKDISNNNINDLVDILIKIMDESIEEWHVILFHMKISTHFDDYEFIKGWLNVTKRLFKFIFLSQTSSNHRSMFVRLFVEILNSASDYDLLFEIYSWLQIDNLDDILFLNNILEEFCITIPDTLHTTKYNLCLCVIQTTIQLISHGFDPTSMFQRLNSLLILCPCASDILLLCCSRTLSLCSSKFVHKTIDFCLNIIQKYGCHKIIAQTVVASILQWSNTKLIDNEKMTMILSIFNSDIAVSKSCANNHKLHPFLSSDSFLMTSYSLIILCPEFSDKQFTSKWLSEINHTGDLLNDTQFNFYLAGLYLSKICDRSQQKTILKLLNKQFLLSLISYSMDREINHYGRFDLMKVIPTAACVPENISLIISLIKRFENSNDETLNKLSIDMYYDLWITEVRCYRFLLYCLSKDKPGWQWNVVKSYTIRKMVKSNPNSDLVSVLKQMLGFYIKHSMHLPMKLTFESLVDLCQAEYMNPESLKNMIDKSNLDIHHPSVISSYCNLLMISSNQITEHDKRNGFFQKLWSMVLHSNDNTVKCALKALSGTDLETMPFNVLPKIFQSYPKVVTQLEDSEKLDLFNGPIPGECWVKFLQSINKKFINEAQMMLSAWLRRELEKNVIIRVQSDNEPKNLKHLSDHSIARGLMSFIVPKRKQMLDADEDTKVACLAVINGADKPMYPFDWGFLEKYVIEGPSNKLWKESVMLIAKQSIKSTSAFRLLHKCYDHRSNFDTNQIKLLVTVLYKVSNIIFHDLQKQFVTDVVNEILNNIHKTHSNSNLDVDMLCHILSEFKQILQSPQTNMENVHFICDILQNIWCTINLENKEILYAFLDCCLTMPTEMLKNLRPYPVQESMLLKFIILCSAQNFISSNTSFDSLNECVQACNQFFKNHQFLYDTVIEVFKLKMFVPYHNELIANFMIYLTSFIKKTNSFTNDLFDILCSIFINLIVTLSGYNTMSFIDNRKLNSSVFPVALATYSKNTSQSSRVIEWLKTMIANSSLPEEYSKLFYCCLAAFKNDKCLLVWANKKKIILH
ncbi:uncharacterized protein LOC132928291 isoform X1 [Rhopalosiphum padi]|uniref:uncharacterized protein LOC132928291 isoform X1 n=2 Tax=Rhopalosiphum padi TaxID=40932 RepID=UPI00298EBEB8|nr:uncharacterized protein LOC132928291 isoform X1 [Rhopalosiphum padi]XP_060848841.1 uncharacterized protein LOC132928291 isoform X1 [Rhopalosiphum padi]